MIKLENNTGLWNAFAGACGFADGTDPLFAEMALSSCPAALDPDLPAVLILDEQAYDGVETVLTVNHMTEEGFPVVYRKALPANLIDRHEAQAWAEKNLSATMSHAALLLAGFSYDEC